ncbi:MAG: hypothetical protein FJX84_02875 [Bacteroidetes bacterium]|nr:hypothetical protein [Bacteroidota bacterium]
MKTLIFGATILLNTTLHAQDSQLKNIKEESQFEFSNEFDVNLFQKYLTQEMSIAFPWMVEDTSNNYAARATSQTEAGSPMCYGSKQGGMVDIKNDELLEAKRIVNKYQEYLYDSPYFGEKTLKKYYKDFSAVATKQNGGLIRYGLLVDNNITRESIMEGSNKILNAVYQDEIDLVDSLVLDYYGSHMKIDNGFDIGCVNYVKEKIESKEIPWADGQAHYHFSISSKDGLPRKETIEEVIKGRLEYMDSLGLPLTISRYYIKIIIEGEMTYLILALDN